MNRMYKLTRKGEAQLLELEETWNQSDRAINNMTPEFRILANINLLSRRGTELSKVDKYIWLAAISRVNGELTAGIFEDEFDRLVEEGYIKEA